MAENNGMRKDGAGFSEKCTELINSYFKAFEHIIILSRGQCPKPGQWHASNSREIQETGSLVNAIIMDAFTRPGILPYLHDLHDKLDDLHYRLEAVLCVEASPGSCFPEMAEKYFSSVDGVIDVVDNEIKDLEGRQRMKEALELSKQRQESTENKLNEFLSQFQEQDEEETPAEVSCSPQPEKEAEKPAVEAEQQRESFSFSRDLLAEGNDCSHILDMLIQQGVLICSNRSQDLNTLCTFLFGGQDLGQMLYVKRGGINGLYTFVSTLADESKRKALTFAGTINVTIRKWFVQSGGKSIGKTTLRNPDIVDSVQEHTKNFCREKGYWSRKENISGHINKGSTYRALE